MTANETEEIMERFLRERVANTIRLKRSAAVPGSFETEYVHPNVFRGYIIPDNAEDELSIYPFICVRVIKAFNGSGIRTVQGEDNLREKRAFYTLRIDYGTYCEGVDENMKPINDGSGHADIWTMMERTRQELYRHMTIGNKLAVQDANFEANIVDECPYPFYAGYILVTVETGMPEVEIFRSMKKEKDLSKLLGEEV